MLKVKAIKDCYLSNNTRARIGKKFFIKNAIDFSIEGMELVVQGGKTIKFKTRDQFAEYCKRFNIPYAARKKAESHKKYDDFNVEQMPAPMGHSPGEPAPVVDEPEATPQTIPGQPAGQETVAADAPVVDNEGGEPIVDPEVDPVVEPGQAGDAGQAEGSSEGQSSNDSVI